MSYFRNKSLDQVNIKEWRWASFLAELIKALDAFNPSDVSIPLAFLDKKEDYGSLANPKKAQTQTWACQTEKLKYLRAACVQAPNVASVLNLLITPSHEFDLPFFGADFVTLSSGHLLALDLQPALKKDQLHTYSVWERLIPLHAHWQSLLPDGGPIPKEAEEYFSPGFLWTRLPLTRESDQIIDEVIKPAFLDYLSLYIELLLEAELISKDRSMNLLAGQARYMQYRANKDPARGMLTRFYGREWTEEYIQNILFKI